MTIKTLHQICFEARCLRNIANYIKRKAYFEHDKYSVNVNDIDKICKGKVSSKKAKFLLEHYSKEIEEIKKHYVFFSKAAAQRIFMRLNDEWKNFFKALKEYKKHPEKYTAKPRVPGYAKKDITLVLQRNAFRVLDNQLVITQVDFKEPIKVRCCDNQVFNSKSTVTKVKELRIVPKSGNNFEIQLAYKEEKQEDNRTEQLNFNNYMGIDLGISNLITIAAFSHTERLHPTLVKGGLLKSYNAKFNKSVAKFTSKKQYEQVEKLSYNRTTFIRDYLHKVSHYVVEYALNHHIGNLVIGYNKGWKQDINLGKKNNQKFCSIPFLELVEKIVYKAKAVGINVSTTDESYTSKASALDFDDIPTYRKNCKKEYKFSGIRKCRGLYISKNNVMLNADCNGAINIIRKKFGNEAVKTFLMDAQYVRTTLNVVKVAKLFDKKSLLNLEEGRS